MAIKGVILPDHVQVNKYQLTVAGLPPLLFTAISGIEEELDAVDLPDRTPQTGGRVKGVEFEVTQPLHHNLERAAMELWFRECHDPVSPLHKKLATLTLFSQTLLNQPSWSLLGLWIMKRALPDLDLDNDGEMAGIVWTMKANELIPLT
jgi:hypothetical protein